MAKYYDKQFKLDAVQYYHDHRDRGLQGCTANLSISHQTLSRWQKELRETGDNECLGSVSGMLNFLGVLKSGYRAWLNHVPSNTEKRCEVIKEKIRDIYDESHQNYGAPKITRELKFSGETVSERTIGKYMKQMGIKAQWETHWTIDGFVYLTSIIDLYSRKIIAWTLSRTLEVSCVVETINKAAPSLLSLHRHILHNCSKFLKYIQLLSLAGE